MRIYACSVYPEGRDNGPHTTYIFHSPGLFRADDQLYLARVEVDKERYPRLVRMQPGERLPYAQEWDDITALEFRHLPANEVPARLLTHPLVLSVQRNGDIHWDVAEAPRTFLRRRDAAALREATRRSNLLLILLIGFGVVAALVEMYKALAH